MKREKKWGRIFLLTAALLFGLCGCQQEDVSKEKTETEAPEKELLEEQWTAEWEEQWTAEMEEGGSIPVNMHCEVVSSEKQPNSIVDTQPMEISSRHKEELAKNLFGNEVYLYDVEHMCEADLQKRLAREESILKWVVKDLTDLQETPTDEGNAYRRKIKKELEEKVKKIKKLLKNAPKEPVPAQDGSYNSDSYMGYINDIAFRLEFNREKVYKNYDFYDYTMHEFDTSKYGRTIELLPVDSREFAPEELAGIEKITSGDFSGNNLLYNDCSLSEEEAKKKAEEMLQKLGCGTMVQVGTTCELAWKEVDTDDKGSVINGYIFNFNTGMDGNVLNTFEGLNPLEDDEAYGAEVVQVQVTDKGVARVLLKDPIQVDSVTPDIKLLEIDDMKDMFKTQIPSLISTYMKAYEEWTEDAPLVDEFRGTSLQLIYFRIDNPENPKNFTYVPVWELTGYFNRVNMVKFYMNAIDGSYITLDFTP